MNIQNKQVLMYFSVATLVKCKVLRRTDAMI